MRKHSSMMARLGVATLLALGATGSAYAEDLQAAIRAADARWAAAFTTHESAGTR